MNSGPTIPKIIHQTWKTSRIPKKWLNFQDKVKALHPDWTYQLWTDNDIDRFVQRHFPDFYSIFSSFERPIMRADVIRYLLLYRIGGVYLDLDYEFFKPFDLNQHSLVLPLNRSKISGDQTDELGNAIMASAPGHPFWEEVIAELKYNPVKTQSYKDVVAATGPQLLTRVFSRSRYPTVFTPSRRLFHPHVPSGNKEYLELVNDNKVYGLHHGWGSWKERLSLVYWQTKMKKLGGNWSVY